MKKDLMDAELELETARAKRIALENELAMRNSLKVSRVGAKLCGAIIVRCAAVVFICCN